MMQIPTPTLPLPLSLFPLITLKPYGLDILCEVEELPKIQVIFIIEYIFLKRNRTLNLRKTCLFLYNIHNASFDTMIKFEMTPKTMW